MHLFSSYIVPSLAAGQTGNTVEVCPDAHEQLSNGLWTPTPSSRLSDGNKLLHPFCREYAVRKTAYGKECPVAWSRASPRVCGVFS